MDRKYKLAVVVLDEDKRAVYGYCPTDFYIHLGDVVIDENNDKGKVAMIDTYMTFEGITELVGTTGLDLVRIMAKESREDVEWGEDDE